MTADDEDERMVVRLNEKVKRIGLRKVK